jgi:GTP-binding protein
MQENLPIVALVGPPNVGKSTLLNKIAGKPLAVTSEISGTTRDRQYIDIAWSKTFFTLVDTAGLSLEMRDAAPRSGTRSGPTTGELEKNIQEQIEVAINQADMVVLIVDGQEPARSIEQKALLKFRKLKKPLVLAVNKLDSPKNLEEKIIEFSRLGIKQMFPISAITGRGIGDLLDHIANVLKKLEVKPQQPQTTTGIAVSIIGKPNVGKSTIFNTILKEERVVVSPLPGTTRTAIDSQISINGNDYSFIDTAGLRKKIYRQSQPDIFSGFQVFKAIRRSDVCLLVIDATQSITKQDQHVAAEIFNMQKGCIILANKIDAYQGDKDRLRDYISPFFPFLRMSPLFFVSGLTGEGLEEAISAIKPIFDARNKKIDNQTLSEFLFKKLKQNPPKILRDQKKPKVFSLHQVDINPPKFELLVNHPAAISMQFRKFLENSIIRDLDFWGTPIVLRLTGKDKA